MLISNFSSLSKLTSISEEKGGSLANQKQGMQSTNQTAGYSANKQAGNISTNQPAEDIFDFKIGVNYNQQFYKASGNQPWIFFLVGVI